MQKTWRIYGPAGEVNYTGGESVRDVNVYTIYWRSGSREESGISRGQAVWALHTIHGQQVTLHLVEVSGAEI